MSSSTAKVFLPLWSENHNPNLTVYKTTVSSYRTDTGVLTFDPVVIPPKSASDLTTKTLDVSWAPDRQIVYKNVAGLTSGLSIYITIGDVRRLRRDATTKLPVVDNKNLFVYQAPAGPLQPTFNWFDSDKRVVVPIGLPEDIVSSIQNADLIASQIGLSKSNKNVSSPYAVSDPNRFRIGYTNLSVNADVISVTRESSMSEIPLMRSKGTLKKGHGHRASMVRVPMSFQGEQEVEKLAQLMRQLRHMPILPVNNDRLSTEGIEALAIASINISTAEGYPGLINAEMVGYDFAWRNLFPHDPSANFRDIWCWPLFKAWCEKDTSYKNRPYPYWNPNKNITDTVVFRTPNIAFMQAVKQQQQELQQKSLVTSDGDVAQDVYQKAQVLSKTTVTPTNVRPYPLPGEKALAEIQQANSSFDSGNGTSPTFQLTTPSTDQDSPSYINAQIQGKLYRMAIFQPKSLSALSQALEYAKDPAYPVVIYYGKPQIYQDSAGTMQLAIPDHPFSVNDPTQGANNPNALSFGSRVNGWYNTQSEVTIDNTSSWVTDLNQRNHVSASIVTSAYSNYISELDALITRVQNDIRGVPPPPGTFALDPRYFTIVGDVRSAFWEKLKREGEGARASVRGNDSSQSIINLLQKDEYWTEWSFRWVLDTFSAGMSHSFATQQPVSDEKPWLQYMGGSSFEIRLAGTFFSGDDASTFKEMMEQVDALAREFKGQGLGSQYSGFLQLGTDKNPFDLARLLGVKWALPLESEITTVPGFPQELAFTATFIEFDLSQQHREQIENLFPDPNNPILDVNDLEQYNEGLGQRSLRQLQLESVIRQCELYPDLDLPTTEELAELIANLKLAALGSFSGHHILDEWAGTEDVVRPLLAAISPGPTGSNTGSVFADPDFFCVSKFALSPELNKYLESQNNKLIYRAVDVCGSEAWLQAGKFYATDAHLPLSRPDVSTVPLSTSGSLKNAGATVSRTQANFEEAKKLKTQLKGSDASRASSQQNILSGIFDRGSSLTLNFNKVSDLSPEQKRGSDRESYLKAVTQTSAVNGLYVGASSSEGAQLPQFFMNSILRAEGVFDSPTNSDPNTTVYGLIQDDWNEFGIAEPKSRAEVVSGGQLVIDQARQIYQVKYYQGSRAPEFQYPLNYIVFDTKVQHGKWLSIIQKAFGDYSSKRVVLNTGNGKTITDNTLGDSLVAKMQSMPPDQAAAIIVNARQNYYRSLPTFSANGRGWLNRMAQLQSLISGQYSPLDASPLPYSTVAQNSGYSLNQINGVGYKISDAPTPTTAEQAFNSWLVDHTENEKMNRFVLAFPCYLILLIDGGRWLRQYRIYDRFFGLQGISEIEIWKSREEPAHTARIVISNMYGNLTSQIAETERQNQADNRPQRWNFKNLSTMVWQMFYPMPTQYLLEMRAMMINSLLLKAGSRLHVRMGYGANPSDLPIAFNGTIMEVPISEGAVEVLALGDGAELTKNISQDYLTTDKYVTDAYVNTGTAGGGANPRDLVCQLFTTTSNSLLGDIANRVTQGVYIHNNAFGIENFGRPSFYNSRLSTLATAAGGAIGGGIGFLAGAGIGTILGGNTVAGAAVGTLAGGGVGATLGDAFSTYRTPGECGVNIYNPAQDPMNTSIEFAENMPWIWRESDVLTGIAVENATPWKVIETCRKVCPDFVTCVNEFETRSTVFFGKPWWDYHYAWDYNKIASQIDSLSKNSSNWQGEFTIDPEQPDTYMKKKAFQQLRMVSSYYNLLECDIAASTEDLYTCCQLTEISDMIGIGGNSRASSFLYFDSEIFDENMKVKTGKSGVYCKFAEKASNLVYGAGQAGKEVVVGAGQGLERIGFSIWDFITGNPAPTTAQEIQQYSSADNSIKALQTNTTLQDISAGFFLSSQPNENAALSELKDGMKKMYRGDILIIGDASYYPFNLVHIADVNSGLTGLFEVRQVTHSMSMETGFTTVLTPDLCTSSRDPQQTYMWHWAYLIARWNLTRRFALKASASITAKILNGQYLGKTFDQVVGKMRRVLNTPGQRALLDKAVNSIRGEGGLIERANGNQIFQAVTSRMQQISQSAAKVAGVDAEAAEAINVLKTKLGGGLLGSFSKLSFKAGEVLNSEKIAAATAGIRTRLEAAGILDTFGALAGPAGTIVTAGVMILTDSLSTALNRALAARKAVVVLPLRVQGKEFSAGITGHRGGVIGDPKSVATSLLELFTNFNTAFDTTVADVTGGQGPIDTNTTTAIGASLVSGFLLLLGIQGPSDSDPNAYFSNISGKQELVDSLGIPDYLDITGIRSLAPVTTSSPGGAQVLGANSNTFTGQNVTHDNASLTGVNPALLADIQQVAISVGVTLNIGTTTVHSSRTTSGNPSRHITGNAVDINRINGQPINNTSGSQVKAWADQVASAFESLGYTRNVENGNPRAVLWGFNDVSRGGNHTNHIHVSKLR